MNNDNPMLEYLYLQVLGHMMVEGRFSHRVKWVELVNHSTPHGRLRNSNRQQFNDFKDKKLSLTPTRAVK